MKMLVKTIPAENGQLYAISAGERLAIANFNGRVEIYEEQYETAILGNLIKGSKKIHASVIVCGDLDYASANAIELVNMASVFEATATLPFTGGGTISNEKICFAGLQFKDSDPYENELIFDISDIMLIEKLLKEA